MNSNQQETNPNLIIEFKFNRSESQEDCVNCNQEMTARLGYIAFERGSWEAVCDDCSGVGSLPLDFDELAKFFDAWRKQSDHPYDFWRFEEGCFLAHRGDGAVIPFAAEAVRKLMNYEPGARSAAPNAQRSGNRTARQILNDTNELARIFYRHHDRGGAVEKGYRFDQSNHPQEIQCWRMACEAQMFFTETDLDDVLSDLDE